MTVSSTTRSETFACNGVTTLFVASFRVLEASTVHGYLITAASGVSVELVNGTDFTVSGVGGANTSITTATAYSALYQFHVKRITARLQETDYRYNDPFPAESHEEALDRLTHIVQEDGETLERALVWPDTETAPVMPPAAQRANTYWANDASGNLVFVAPIDGTVGSFAIQLASYANAGQGAGMVGYAPSLVYAANTVGAALNQKKTLPDFGAVGDGVTDDSTAVQDAITAYGGRVIDGLGRTYKCNAVLTGLASGTTLRNMVLDFSDIAAAGARYLEATGTKGSAVALTANLAVDAVAVSVGSTASFADEGWAWLESTAVWAAGDGTIYGQFVKVKTVDSGTAMTLYAGTIVPFNTAASATISPVTPVVGVKFQNVKVIGSGANSQYGLYVTYGLDCFVGPDCTFTDCDRSAVALYRCINTRAAPTVLRARAIGLSYGVTMASGCLGCATDGGYGEDVRHYVTAGDNDGININCRATDNVVMYARSAGIDSHAASFNFLASGNQITLANGAGDEGITLQGLNGQAIDNTIRGVVRAGVLLQPLVTASGYKNKGVARGNHIHFVDGAAGTQAGVYAQIEGTNGTDWESCDIDGNTVYGGAGSAGSIHFYARIGRASGVMANVNIRGNVSTQDSISQGIFVRAEGAGSAMSNVSITGNHAKTSGTRNVYVLADGAGATLDGVTVLGNSIDGGSVANISIIGNAGTVSNVIEDNNTFANGGDLYEVSGTTTGLKLKSAKHVSPVTISAGTGSTEPDTDWYVFDNAGTVTFTLPAASIYPGRELTLRTIQAQAVNSASSNVVPRTGGSASTAILPATDGAWATLKSDGTNWQAVAGS